MIIYTYQMNVLNLYLKAFKYFKRVDLFILMFFSATTAEQEHLQHVFFFLKLLLSHIYFNSLQRTRRRKVGGNQASPLSLPQDFTWLQLGFLMNARHLYNRMSMHLGQA